MQFIGKTQDGSKVIYAEKGKLRTRDDRRRVVRVQEEVHIYTDEEVARELELKVRYSVHQDFREDFDDLEDFLPTCHSITVTL